MKNQCLKLREKENPYEIWKTADGSWEWRVLKKWQVDDDKPYARWFCAVKSPYTFGSFDLGDVYVKEIKEVAGIWIDPDKAGEEVAVEEVAVQKRCNKGHLLVEEYEDTEGKVWFKDCPICIEEMINIRKEANPTDAFGFEINEKDEDE